MTNDIDVVVELDPFDAQAICNAFGADEFYISATAAHEAVEASGQFNLLHPASGNKIDFMVVADAGWARSQLDRSVEAPLLPDRSIRVARPEDVILGKLLYYREGGSEKHIRDINGILTSGAVEVDHDYLDGKVQELGVADEWQSILDKLGMD